MNILFLVLFIGFLVLGVFSLFTWTIVLLGIVALIIIWAITFYNNFIILINRAKEAWADIEVQLKRRYDLIPNLVNTVKGYATHEAGTFEKVTEARSNAMNNQGPTKEHAEAENMLSGALKSIFALAENYPDLKANTNFLELQRELSDTENKIQAARRFYNANVRDLNTGLEQFPANILASVFKFKNMEFFDLGDDEKARNPVEVKF